LALKSINLIHQTADLEREGVFLAGGPQIVQSLLVVFLADPELGSLKQRIFERSETDGAIEQLENLVLVRPGFTGID
jgi:hypothetical protein